MELKGTNELRLSFLDVKDVPIQAKLSATPHRDQKHAPVVMIGSNRTPRALLQVQNPQQLAGGEPGKTEDFSRQNPRESANALGTIHRVRNLRGNPIDFRNVGIRLRRRFSR